jgi:hypothetical protein
MQGLGIAILLLSIVTVTFPDGLGQPIRLAVVFGLGPVLCSERERPFFVPSPAIGFPERAQGVKGPKR